MQRVIWHKKNLQAQAQRFLIGISNVNQGLNLHDEKIKL